MAVYTSLTNEQIAEFLAAHYDIGALEFALGIAQGVENSNYLIAVRDAGGAEVKYILTLYEKRVNPADLPFFLGLLEHVAGRGVAVPRPIARKDGALFGECAGKQAALVSFLEGMSCTVPNEQQVAAVGTALGQLHKAAVSFTSSRANTLSLEGWKEIYAKVEGKLDNIEIGLESLVRSELAYVAEYYPPKGKKPYGIIHGDLFPDNVFFEGDAVSGIIDFYFACNDWIAYDVAITINAWCFEAHGKFNSQKAILLLQNYNRERLFSEAEYYGLPVFLRAAALRFLLTRAHDWIFRDPNALVRPHDPLEYSAKLRFHRGVKEVGEYGL